MVIRRATWRDLWWLWRLRNLPDVIATSESGRGVGWWEHVRWWWSTGQHWELCLPIIAEESGCRLGMARVDRTDWTVSIAVQPSARRIGVGITILRAITRWTAGPLTARIHFDNEPSRLLFHRAGFHCTHRDGPWYVYRYDPPR